jgi:hypothetical protein
VIAEPRMDGCGGAILNAAGASLTVKCSAFTGNQVVGGDGGGDLGGLGCGGALWNDGTANVEYVIFRDNQATGGATTSPDPANYDMVLGGLGWGGAVSSQDQGTLTVRNCWFTGNRAVGGQGKGGGYAVDTGALFGFPDTASVTLNGGSKVNHNHPDDAFHF